MSWDIFALIVATLGLGAVAAQGYLLYGMYQRIQALEQSYIGWEKALSDVAELKPSRAEAYWGQPGADPAEDDEWFRRGPRNPDESDSWTAVWPA